jgi:hypothetical protein
MALVTPNSMLNPLKALQNRASSTYLARTSGTDCQPVNTPTSGIIMHNMTGGEECLKWEGVLEGGSQLGLLGTSEA